MRHAAVSLADELQPRVWSGEEWDVLWCTDMLNLAEFRGLAPPSVAGLPRIVYFHENQLTYPVREDQPRDLHFAFTNFTTAVAADALWFNSGFHRDEFLTALSDWLPRMPDYPLTGHLPVLTQKSHVHTPGVTVAPWQPRTTTGPLRLLWVSRWEHDKAPEVFFEALHRLDAAGIDFRIDVLGESYRQTPSCFDTARQRFSHRIDQWGHLASVDSYRERLAMADAVVSTARHEFFGIGVLEAVCSGCVPVVPRALAYPELYEHDLAVFHDNTVDGLARALIELNGKRLNEQTWPPSPEAHRRLHDRYNWDRRTTGLDAAVTAVVEHTRALRQDAPR